MNAKEEAEAILYECGRPFTGYHTIERAITSALESRDKRIKELEAALKPFSDFISGFEHYSDTDRIARKYSGLEEKVKNITVGEFRKAAEVLKRKHE